MSSLSKSWVTIAFAPFITCAFAVGLSLVFAAPAFAGHLNASALQDGRTYDRFIVRFNKNAPERGNAVARQQLLDAVGRGHGVRIGQLRRLAVGADVIKTDRKLDRAAAQQLMQRLARNPHVDYVEPDAIRRPSFTPNDTNYASQWHYFEAAAGINLPAAWDKATGSGVVVAVIDTGIVPHSDLSANVVAGYDFISDPDRARDGNGRDSNPNDEGDWTVADDCDPGSLPEVSSWHGTHVAGTIAAVTNNAKGVAGVAFNAKVMPLRVLGKCGGFTSDISDAVVWAAGGTVSGVPANSNPAEVINMSLGGQGTCETTTQAAINMAVAAGAVVVVAAGNDNNEVANYSPASCSNVITVAAVGRTGARASYSNHGSKVDVAAPGGSGGNTVLSTLNTGNTTQGSESYAGYQGTSMATPHVAGTVALMQSARVNSPAVVEAVLKSTARTFPVPCSGCGTGIIDASAAISAGMNPTLIIGDATIVEGNSGTRLATFTVSLSQPVGTVVRFDIATSNGTATAGSDYVARSLTGQSMAAGVTSKTFAVTINGDTAPELTEAFFVNVSNVVGVAVADAQATGTIVNDDAVPLANGASATGITASIGQQFLYSMTVPAGASNLSFTTTGDSGDVDLYVKFGSAPTTTVFDCSSTTPTTQETCSISPAQAGTYYILLDAYTDISGVTLTGQYTVPSLSIADLSVTEGPSGTRLATFTVKLSRASTSAVTYNIGTANGTATAGSDYVARSVTGESIAAGLTSKTFAVTINGDGAVEANETFLVNLSAPVGAILADGQAIGTIINDDGPTLSIADVSITEGDKGSRLATFTVKLSQAAASAVTYNIATADATAIAGIDYVSRSMGGETIPAGLTSKTFTVELKGDTTVEADETFMVNLTAAVGATIADFRAIGAIINDDANSDILWRNSSTGANMLWKSANAATVQSMTGVSSQAWKIVGVGDFSGDGKDDVLWRNTSTGANTIWKSADSTAVQSMGGVNPTLGWQIVGVGNFNGDGKDDVLWRNTSSGANTIWKSANSATVQPMTGLSDQAWKIVGVGDFDGDGKDDVMWRNSNTGANTVWKSANAANVLPMTGVSNLAWKVAGIGDFDGDGKDDVLWRNGSTGANTIWKSANATTPQSMTGVTNLDWRIVGTGDYNADGKDDVLWRNASAGTNSIWKSANGSTLQAVAPLVDLAWVVAP
jgi:serine protease